MTALYRIRILTQHIVGSASSQEVSQGRVMQINPATAGANTSLERAIIFTHQLVKSAQLPSANLATKVIKNAPPLPPRRLPPLPPRHPSSFLELFHRALRSFLSFFKIA
jgi:hypothetical protein